MEFDCYQHYYFNVFDMEEDFYKSTAPSEDIWKKFELLPTPPMSPERTLSGGLCKVLGQEEDCESPCIPDTEKLFGNLSSIIIQDCMWSSFSVGKQPEKVSGRVPAVAQAAVSPVTKISVRPTKAQCVSPCGALATLASDCVDPAAVLTIPTSSSRKPASSCSDSSDEDDEEIDVVTVESKQNRMRLVNIRKPVTVTVRADPCPKRFHASVHRQQHNYAARSPDSDTEYKEEEEDNDSDEEPPSKHTWNRSASSSPRTSTPTSPSETPQNSDTEDTDRRRNHNYLERKRRNDLRSRFLALREQIPGLESAKTPKVAILTHATDYLLELHRTERRHLKEKRHLKTRQQGLLRRLSELKRS
ncbi:protein L-Myc-1b-like [Takifugu flavidus]|uniref:Protein L-Myc-1b n=1 Tax=Takifugu flavidus TaxID=433684 RepID=A0A5C6NY73_9TELE|nr:protein L-Myc-1b-like [Takifugu flavidus]TWW72263.1 Protein L-Myc-1b [Takifugu flavidus]